MPLTIAESLRQTRQRLIDAGIDPAEAALESRVLHQEVLGVSGAQLYAHPNRLLTGAERMSLDRLLGRRVRREPLAHVIGRREFFGFSLRVDHRALIPRPETELLVELAIAAAAQLPTSTPLAVDVGTGSGAIAIALARSLPSARIAAVDRSPDALALAAENVREHGLADRVLLVAGDLLTPIRGRIDLIVANLPYIPNADVDTLAPEVRDFEPRLALAGGPDGLDVYRRLLAQAVTRLDRAAALLLEIGEGQGEPARRLVAEALPDATVHLVHDYAGVERVVSALRTV